MGGWLVLFCIILIISAPISFVRVGIAWSHVGRMVPLFSLKGITARIIELHFFLFAMMSLVAGIWLVTIRSKALLLARIFLITYPIVSLAIVLTAYVTGFKLSSEFVLYRVVQPLGFSFIWFSYLSQSQRVKATYVD